MARNNSQEFDVLVVDAFAGDAIPVHLLTQEAIAIYLGELNPNGVLAIHISNRYLDLRPVVHELAKRFNLNSGLVHSDGGPFSQPSDWILLARTDKVLGQPEVARRATVAGLAAQSPALDRRLQQPVSDSEVIGHR